MGHTIRSSFFLLLGALLAAGCAHETTPPPALPHAEYRIGREDIIEVEVWKDPTLSAKVPVRPDGMISLPMIGDVQAAGRTADDLKGEIAKRLKPFVAEPVVGVMVSEIAARFYVLGEVAHPGAFPVRGNLTVLQGLAMAGGTTEFADPRSVVVIRPNSSGAPHRYKVDARSILAGHARAIVLEPGDTIYVP